MSKMIITGSRGFIGTAVRKTLRNCAYTEIDSKVFTDYRYLKDKTGTLIHLAASINERESFSDPLKYIDNNISGLALLLKNNNFDKVIFPSSITVYDNKGNLNPETVYGMTKLAGEQLIKIYAPQYWILRITNPFGPHDVNSVFARLKHCKLNGETFQIYNNPNALKDFFHVDHVASVIQKIIDGEIKLGTYNVGSGRGTVVVDMLKSLCERFSIDYKVINPPQGISSGYIPTESLLTQDYIKVEQEWVKYLNV